MGLAPACRSHQDLLHPGDLLKAFPSLGLSPEGEVEGIRAVDPEAALGTTNEAGLVLIEADIKDLIHLSSKLFANSEAQAGFACRSITSPVTSRQHVIELKSMWSVPRGYAGPPHGTRQRPRRCLSFAEPKQLQTLCSKLFALNPLCP